MMPDTDLPLDPDFDDVPPELLAIAADPEQDGSGMTTVVIVPGLFGHARRLRDGFYGDDGAA